MILVFFPMVVLSLIIMSSATDPYIIQVTQSCSDTINGATTLHVVIDVYAKISALCKDNFTTGFTTSDDVNFYAEAKYLGDSNRECLFTRKATGQIYWLEVRVAWGKPEAVILKNSHQYVVTCSLDNQTSQNSVQLNRVPGLITKQELQYHLGSKSTSSFSLDVTDVNGVLFADSPVPIGKKIQLLATISGNQNEVGLRVSSCSAMDQSSVYPIIIGGCGEGVIIPDSAGFRTEGNQARSPFFDAFQLSPDSSIQFACNFTACRSNCDGDNCLSERRKRNVDYEMKNSTEIRTAPIHLSLQYIPDIEIYQASTKPPFYRLRTTPSDLEESEKYFRKYLRVKHSGVVTIIWGVVVGVIIFTVAMCTTCFLFFFYVVGSGVHIFDKAREIVQRRRLNLHRF